MAQKIINSFPGYKYENGKNIYRDTDIGFGGYIISNPGMYTDVVLLDIESLHPNSIRAMNCFGDYTKNFTDILDARIAIKHKDYDTARKMLNGRLAPYLKDESTATQLAQALKIAINSVYGLTAANFENPFRDLRNKNNIVALRGALFMRTLQDEVENRGFKIVAIKTDSIKIANANNDIIKFCMDFAKKYSYTFKHEATYSRMCQINDADYIAKYRDPKWCMDRYGYIPGDNEEHAGEWTATGARFAVPYVFKKLFSKEPIVFEDMCETKSVTSALYLDLNERLPNVSEYEEVMSLRMSGKSTFELRKKDVALLEAYKHVTDEELANMIAEGHDYHFVGKVGNFCPIKPNCGGGELLREGKDKNGNATYASATGAKGYRWLESETVKESPEIIDRSYYDRLIDDAVDAISQYGDFEWFVSDDEVFDEKYMTPPWLMPCGKESCFSCPHFTNTQFDMDCKLGHDISDMAQLMNKNTK